MEKREESNNENIKLKLNKDYCKDDVINMFVERFQIIWNIKKDWIRK